ncbi:hypothetical protein ACE6H2_017680 [Prunus campanulata]
MLLRLPTTCRVEDGGGSGAVVVVHEPCPRQTMDATKAEQEDLTGMSQWLRALSLRGSQGSQAGWREPWLSH